MLLGAQQHGLLGIEFDTLICTKFPNSKITVFFKNSESRGLNSEVAVGRGLCWQQMAAGAESYYLFVKHIRDTS